jgi:hypothetical protein
MTEKYLEQINALIPIHQDVAGINPALHRLYPVIIAEGGTLLIYDSDESPLAYRFIKRSPAPMPIPKGVRAAFQLEDYGGRIVCVVTPDVFDNREGYVTILHEFVHCYQYETCEQTLKIATGCCPASAGKRRFYVGDPASLSLPGQGVYAVLCPIFRWLFPWVMRTRFG